MSGDFIARASDSTVKDVDAWLAHLTALHEHVIELGLARVRAVQSAMGLQPACPVILVGGTNGKGSVCAFLERIYVAAGFKVGCYTSPHLLRYQERIRINAKQIGDDALCMAFDAIERGRQAVALSYFEFSTLAAVFAFNAANVDVMILEVGLGGRLDAVNIFDADCAIITSMDLDHQSYLGDTREKIAWEKAHIGRKNKPLCCADPAPPNAMLDFAHENGLHFKQIGLDFGYKKHEQQWDAWYGDKTYHALPFPALRGHYQLSNASAALAAITVLQSELPVAMGAIRRGLLEVNLPGRFEILPGRPVVVLDVGHNPHAARALAHNIQRMGYAEKTFAVCGMLQDKDIQGVLSPLSECVDHWLMATLPGERGAEAATLVSSLRAVGCTTTADDYASPQAAFAAAQSLASERDRIIVFGSFLTVSHVLTALKRVL